MFRFFFLFASVRHYKNGPILVFLFVLEIPHGLHSDFYAVTGKNTERTGLKNLLLQAGLCNKARRDKQYSH